MKITAQLDHVSHCKATPGTNFSNRRTSQVFMTIPFASRLPFGALLARCAALGKALLAETSVESGDVSKQTWKLS